jgi:hypothetical protein
MLISANLPGQSVSRYSISKRKRKLRAVLSSFVVKETANVLLEGPVEIDESMLFKPKKGYENRARAYKSKKWVLGLKCRTSNKFLLFPSRNRDRATLVAIILKHVQHGAWIYSDCWSAYVNPSTFTSYLEVFGYTHLYVNHRYHFVDPVVNAIHINTIERLWRSARRYLRSEQPRVYVDEYLSVFYLQQTRSRGEIENILLKEISRV